MEGGGVREQQFRRPTSAIRIFCGRPRFDQCEDDPGDERRELSQSVLAPLGLKTAMSDLVPKRSPVLTKPPCGLDVAAQRRHEILELHPIVARPETTQHSFEKAQQDDRPLLRVQKISIEAPPEKTERMFDLW